MATNANSSGKSKKTVKKIKNKSSKNQKNNIFSPSGITEHSSEEEEEKDQQIKIYYKDKIATIYMKISEPFSNFINIIKERFKIENFEKKFEVFYNHKEIPLSDARLMFEIITRNNNNNIEEEEELENDIIFELREKFIKNMGYKDKLYIELENVPSFMDLTTQISYFISLQNKEVDYELNYNNNVYTLLFSSNQIGFSFVSFMSNLKFTNKYYRKLKVDIHYNTKIKNNIHSPENSNKILCIFPKTKHKKSKSYGNLFNNNISNDEYNRNNNNFINNSIPYEQEKLMRRIENAKNRKKWMNLKGFFTSANLQSFNSLISPNIKIHKIKIKNDNKKKNKVLYLNQIDD